MLPLYILAGQSNAGGMRAALDAALTARHGADGFLLVDVTSSGAPLTFARSGDDWASEGELPARVVAATLDALTPAPDARVEGIVWIQGEADTHLVARGENWAEDLGSLWDGIRAGIASGADGHDIGTGTADLVISGLSARAPDAEQRAQWSTIRAEQTEAAGDTLTRLVDPDTLAGAGPGMFKDGLHYAESFKPILANALLDAIRPNDASTAPEPGEGGVTVSGTSGADILEGGSGDDVYLINHRDDTVVERAEGGHDTVVSVVSFSLRANSQHLEDLTLSGEGDLRGTGNARDNVILGNSGDNRLKGGKGDDRLEGGAGNDRFIDNQGSNVMVGGAGSDRYRIGAAGNRIEEDPGQGDDHVLASISFTLRDQSQHIERLTLTGDRAIDGIGNALDNVITGNRAGNRLDGAWGDDRIDGRAGHDTLLGGVGNDILTGGRGRDTFLFRENQGQDTVTDFAPARDSLQFARNMPLDKFLIEGTEDGTRITYGEFSLHLDGVAPGEISVSDFLF